ncbi:hypothetical protein BH18ACI4_BH18ACI4_12960 [soil metagenome]
MRTADNSFRHYRNCNLCEAICGIEITVQDPLREPSNEKTSQPSNGKTLRRLDIRGDKTTFSAAGTSARRPSPCKIFATIKTG